MSVKIIAAIGKNRELGANNALLWHIPEDMKFFREVTRGACVVMGRLTYESIGRPLPGRRNIIISHNPGFCPEGTEVFALLEEALGAAASGEREVFIIGGASVYRQALEKGLADEMLLTEIDGEFPSADAYFPEFDREKWRAELLDEADDGGYLCRWVRYLRR